MTDINHIAAPFGVGTRYQIGVVVTPDSLDRLCSDATLLEVALSSIRDRLMEADVKMGELRQVKNELAVLPQSPERSAQEDELITKMGELHEDILDLGVTIDDSGADDPDGTFQGFLSN